MSVSNEKAPDAQAAALTPFNRKKRRETGRGVSR